jgi:hypothetical protein
MPNGSSASFSFSGKVGQPQHSADAATRLGGDGGEYGKSGLLFDHILNRLQGELQNRKTGQSYIT